MAVAVETVEKRPAQEVVVTKVVDGHMDSRKARTREWLARGFGAVAAGLVLVSAGIVTAIPFPALGVGLLFGGALVGAYGGISTAIGVGSAVFNTFSRR